MSYVGEVKALKVLSSAINFRSSVDANFSTRTGRVSTSPFSVDALEKKRVEDTEAKERRREARLAKVRTRKPLTKREKERRRQRLLDRAAAFAALRKSKGGARPGRPSALSLKTNPQRIRNRNTQRRVRPAFPLTTEMAGRLMIHFSSRLSSRTRRT